MIDLDEIERLAREAQDAVTAFEKAPRGELPSMHLLEHSAARRAMDGLHAELSAATILALVARLRAAEAVVEVMPGVLGLLRKAQDVLTQYLIPDGNDADTALDALLALLDGPEQRAAQNPARAAVAAYRALTEEPNV